MMKPFQDSLSSITSAWDVQWSHVEQKAFLRTVPLKRIFSKRIVRVIKHTNFWLYKAS